MFGFHNFSLYSPPFRAFVRRVSFPGKQIPVEFAVKPIKELVSVVVVQENAVKGQMGVLQYVVFVKALQSRGIQSRAAVLILPVKEKLDKDHACEEVMAYVVVN